MLIIIQLSKLLFYYWA